MLETIGNYYDWIKTFHIISMVAWMAGMLYLPRLYVYHTQAKAGSEMDKTFQLMEMRLLRFIMNPAMILTVIGGLLLAFIYGLGNLGIWFHIKFLCVLALLGVHGLIASYRKDFAIRRNTHSARFYKILNESVTFLLIIIVIMVVVKPFE